MPSLHQEPSLDGSTPWEELCAGCRCIWAFLILCENPTPTNEEMQIARLAHGLNNASKTEGYLLQKHTFSAFPTSREQEGQREKVENRRLPGLPF